MRVRPRAGLLVRDPVTPAVPIPQEGAEVPKTVYWRRRLARGDVELLEDTEALRAIEAAQPATEEQS